MYSKNPEKALLHPLNSLIIINESSKPLISFLQATYSKGGRQSPSLKVETKSIYDYDHKASLFSRDGLSSKNITEF